MIINIIKLIEFRNYKALTLRPHESLTVLCGQNAQGKTNVLESIYLCASGRSHRTNKDLQMIAFGSTSAYVRIDVFRELERRIEIKMMKEKGKQIKLNGAPIARIGELMGCLNAVMFSPEDLRLVKDGPSERRRFMDVELSQTHPAYFYLLTSYMHSLKQRNAQLRRISMGVDKESSLVVWDEQLAESGSKISAMRRDFMRSVDIISREIHAMISGNKEQLSAVYQTDIDAYSESDTQEKIMSLFFDGREDDIKKGTTSKGLHRDDVILRLNGRDARAYASQGQQRTAALALKMAELQLMHEQTGERPILLLDDVMSELDEARQEALNYAASKYQTLMTCTVAPKSIDGDVYSVYSGQITKI